LHSSGYQTIGNVKHSLTRLCSKLLSCYFTVNLFLSYYLSFSIISSTRLKQIENKLTVLIKNALNGRADFIKYCKFPTEISHVSDQMLPTILILFIYFPIVSTSMVYFSFLTVAEPFISDLPTSWERRCQLVSGSPFDFIIVSIYTLTRYIANIIHINSFFFLGRWRSNSNLTV